MVLYTDKIKISEVRKEVNKIDAEFIVIYPNIELEKLVTDTQLITFVNQLITMTTDIAESKRIKVSIVLDYGSRKLRKSQEQKLENILEQMIHRLNFTDVALLINAEGKDNITTGFIRSIKNLVLLDRRSRLNTLKEACN